MSKQKKKLVSFLTLVIGGILAVAYPLIKEELSTLTGAQSTKVETSNITTDQVPKEYDGKYQELVLTDNRPTFDQDELSLSDGVWQTYSDLDSLNRVGVANALIGNESFPTEKREGLNVKPTGWNQKKLADGQ